MCCFLFIICLYICVCEYILKNNIAGVPSSRATSGFPQYCASTCVRFGCTRHASCVDSKPKKKQKTKWRQHLIETRTAKMGKTTLPPRCACRQASHTPVPTPSARLRERGMHPLRPPCGRGGSPHFVVLRVEFLLKTESGFVVALLQYSIFENSPPQNLEFGEVSPHKFW